MMNGLSFFIPELISLGLLAYFLVTAIFAGKRDNRSIFGELAFATLILLTALISCSHRLGQGFGGMISADSFSFYFKLIFTAAFFVITFICRDFFEGTLARKQEFGLILWCPLIGLYFLASATHLLVMFIALEILTMSLYIMASYMKHHSASIEAGLKYLILGSIASGFMIFGIALLYMQTGELSFAGIAASKDLLFHSKLGLLALLFIFGGLGFKAASFPFQLWVPDVYQGAPSPVAAFMSVLSKSAAFLLLIRFFILTVGPLNGDWKIIFAGLAFLTLIYGNLGALGQTSLKRLMGYSSIGHAGYLMMALAVGTNTSASAILYYLAGYAASTLIVFYAITLVEKSASSDHAKNLEGLSETSPFLASTLTIGLLSLAGIPPFAGFMGKLAIIYLALHAGLSWLALAGLLMIVIALYYYFSLILKMYFRFPSTSTPISISVAAKTILFILSLITFGLGLFQAPFARIAVAALRF